jgi:GTPase SAR1 family protein
VGGQKASRLVLQVLVLGTAGSGKTQLSYNYTSWLRREGTNAKVVNLDPGAEVTPFDPDWDIRKIISVNRIMRSEKLGPNGAMLRAAEQMLAESRQIVAGLKSLGGEYVVLDTPGQIELFVFHSSGPKLVGEFSGIARTVGVFLLDPVLTADPANLAAALAQSIVVRVRLDIPLVIVATKSDLSARKDLAKMLSDADYLASRVEHESTGSASEAATILVDVIRRLPWSQRAVSVSSVTQDGFEDLHGLLHEAFCACGDLT